MFSLTLMATMVKQYIIHLSVHVRNMNRQMYDILFKIIFGSLGINFEIRDAVIPV